MRQYDAKDIRNICLVGHVSSGKTSLGEALLYASGTVPKLGEVDRGTSNFDTEAEEKKRKMSINTALYPCEWEECKLNLIDIPGFGDFAADLLGGMRVADCAIVTVCAASGVEVQTEKAWEAAAEEKKARLIFVNKMDRENADFEKVLEELRGAFGLKVAPLLVPVGAAGGFKGVVDLRTMKALAFGADGKKTGEEDVPEDMKAKCEELREKMVESVAETDDALTEKYLDAGELSLEEINKGLLTATLRGELFPVLCGSARKMIGISPMLDFMRECCPSPLDVGEAKGEGDVAVAPVPDGKTCAFVFKTAADRYEGRLNLIRVYSGAVRANESLLNGSRDEEESLSNLYMPAGESKNKVTQVGLGDLGAASKLEHTYTGDTLYSGEKVVLPPLSLPEPTYAVAVEPKSKGDEDKMGMRLRTLTEGDPCVRFSRNAETKQAIVAGMGETQINIIISRLKDDYNVEVVLSEPRIAYRETIRGKAEGHHRHKKQTGGRGQFGEVFLRVEPAARGAGLDFVNAIRGGAIDKSYIPGVEKGIREAMEKGILAGCQVVDVKVSLYDGKYHDVDSSEQSFKIAGSMAFKKAFEAAKPVLLEPVMELKVFVPGKFMGDVMGDLNGKRGRVLGTEDEGRKMVISAHAPQAEIMRYNIDLNSITQGRGYFTAAFDTYEEVPAHVASKIIEAAKPEGEGEDE